jgi:molybdate transport system substrate-binding protein
MSVLFEAMVGRFRQVLAVAAASSMLLAGCETDAPQPTPITVYATSAMIHSLTEIGKKFERDNPGASVEYIFADSSDLAGELSSGAGADVFVSGDPVRMDELTRAGLIRGRAIPFASNRLVIVTRPGNPAHLTTFADLVRPGTRLAACSAQMTCANSARQIEHQTGITLRPAAQEVTSADVIRDVVNDKADAGLVFVSEAVTAGPQIGWVDFPESAPAEALCSVALLKSSDQIDMATKFIREVTALQNRPLLADAGFGPPPTNAGR